MDTHLARARFLVEHDRFEQGLQELQLQLAQDPNDVQVHLLRAYCLLGLKRFPEALEAAQQAVGLAPDAAGTFYVLAVVLFRMDRNAEAHTAIREAIALDPFNPDLFCLQGEIFLDEYRWQEALEAANNGLAAQAEHIGCNNLRAMALVKLGRREEAGQTIDAALERDPENAWTHANYGWTLLHQREPRRALEHFREALRIDPQMEWARIGIVEAMKARNILYRWMLSFFLWMTRLPPRFQWGVIIGALIGQRVLNNLADTYPALEPFVLPILIVYVVFAIMTWLADPLFNLLLRCDRFGRHALSSEQVRTSNWVGLTMVIALATLTGGLLDDDGFLKFAALNLGIALLPLSTIFRCAEGWPRTVVIGYALGLLSVGVFFIGFSRLEEGPAWLIAIARLLFQLVPWSWFLLPWVVNAMLTVRLRRKLS